MGTFYIKGQSNWHALKIFPSVFTLKNMPISDHLRKKCAPHTLLAGVTIGKLQGMETARYTLQGVWARAASSRGAWASTWCHAPTHGPAGSESQEMGAVSSRGRGEHMITHPNSLPCWEWETIVASIRGWGEHMISRPKPLVPLVLQRGTREVRKYICLEGEMKNSQVKDSHESKKETDWKSIVNKEETDWKSIVPRGGKI